MRKFASYRHWAEGIILLCGGIVVTATTTATAKKGVAVGVIATTVAVAVTARAKEEEVVVGVVAAVTAAVGAGEGSCRSHRSHSCSHNGSKWRVHRAIATATGRVEEGIVGVFTA